ncbi:hypothetical protein CDAR_529901 [Caerostris darwini]|uniref:Uncharacterized protein n=1 Tax=Caerostris darwini TaxID=1538125 RepID=A0AAV4QI83_9ARAC|nr:hypothetical protein CDAR_529901 [Caerostris darwini]
MREIFPSVSMHPISGFILPSPITCPILNLCSVPHRGAQAWRRKWVKEFPDESGSIPPFLISILPALFILRPRRPFLVLTRTPGYICL